MVCTNFAADMKAKTKNRSLLLCLLAVLLCLLFGCGGQASAPQEQQKEAEVWNMDNDSLSKKIIKRDTVIHKTKAQYVIY